MLTYLGLVAGFALLIKGADWLVKGASSIARSLHVSEFVVGLTVVSFGTSLPELVIGIVASGQGSPDLVIGNVVGSNIVNVLLVLGAAAIIYPLSAKPDIVWREIPFTLLMYFCLVAFLNDGFFDGADVSILSRTDSIALLVFFLIFAYSVARTIRRDKKAAGPRELVKHKPTRSLVEIVAGGAGLFIGGRIAVSAAVDIASSWGLSEAFIGLTVVAVGTSLPELATSTVAAYRKNVDIAVGNVVGSNLFNTFIVLGVVGVLNPIPFNTAINWDLGVMIFAAALLFAILLIGKPASTISRGKGVLFLGLYAAYLVSLVIRG